MNPLEQPFTPLPSLAPEGTPFQLRYEALPRTFDALE